MQVLLVHRSPGRRRIIPKASWTGRPAALKTSSAIARRVGSGCTSAPAFALAAVASTPSISHGCAVSASHWSAASGVCGSILWPLPRIKTVRASARTDVGTTRSITRSWPHRRIHAFGPRGFAKAPSKTVVSRYTHHLRIVAILRIAIVLGSAQTPIGKPVHLGHKAVTRRERAHRNLPTTANAGDRNPPVSAPSPHGLAADAKMTRCFGRAEVSAVPMFNCGSNVSPHPFQAFRMLLPPRSTFDKYVRTQHFDDYRSVLGQFNTKAAESCFSLLARDGGPHTACAICVFTCSSPNSATATLSPGRCGGVRPLRGVGHLIHALSV